MYAYLDRPVASLDAGDHLFLDAFRAWGFARHWQRNPVELIARRLPVLHEHDAVDLIDAVMTALDASDTALALRRPCHELVDDDEAVLLGIARLARDGRPIAATAAIALLIEPAAADRVALLLTEAWSRVGRAVMVSARR